MPQTQGSEDASPLHTQVSPAQLLLYILKSALQHTQGPSQTNMHCTACMQLGPYACVITSGAKMRLLCQGISSSQDSDQSGSMCSSQARMHTRKMLVPLQLAVKASLLGPLPVALQLLHPSLQSICKSTCTMSLMRHTVTSCIAHASYISAK